MKIECTIQELIELIENKKETPVVFTTGAKNVLLNLLIMLNLLMIYLSLSRLISVERKPNRRTHVKLLM